MFIRFIHTHTTAWFSILVYRFGLKKLFPQKYVIGKNLITRAVDRLPEHFRTSLTGPWRIFRIGKSAIYQKGRVFIRESEEPVAVFDGSLNVFKTRADYIRIMCGARPGLGLAKDLLSSASGKFWKAMSVITMFFSAFFLTLIIPFSKNKTNLSILPLSLVEDAHLLWILKKHKIEKIFYCCMYHTDANLAAFLIMKYGVEVIKIPSELPLIFHNREVIADKLALCFRYQEDEVKLLKDTMYVKEILHWVPETVITNALIYVHKQFPTPEKTIAYYSSANGLRLELGHLDFKDDSNTAELELLSLLGEYKKAHPEITLQIYLHPLEKADEKTLESCLAWYQKLLPGVEYKIMNKGFYTSQSFHQSDLAVTVGSAVIFERIFFGFKSMLYTARFKIFPLPDSRFKNICANNKEEFISLLDKNINLSQEDFFIKNNIENYTWRSYPEFVKWVRGEKR